MTPDGFPIIGWAKNVEGFLHAAGTCGQGFMLGPGIGELLQRVVSNSLTELDLEILPYVAPDRDFSGQELLK
jgi:sarcosine oxidase subunit beta